MRRLAAVAIVAGAAIAALAAPARAHAGVESTDPANGALLDTAPEQIGITFTEPPDLSLTLVDIVDRTGASVPTGPVEGVHGDALAIRVVPDPLPDGVYTVTWRTVSKTDGHVTSGAFSFGVGVAEGEVLPVPPGRAEETPPPSPMAVAGRWVLYVGLVVLVGAAVAGLFALGPSVSTRPWLLGLAWTLAAFGVVLMTLAERSAVGVPLGVLLASDAGGKLVALAVAVAVTGVATIAVVVRPGRATLRLLGLTAAGAMLVRAAGGHAGSPATVLVQWIHLLGVSIWIGGLAWLLVGLKHGLEPAQVRRYSRLALIGLVIVVASGALRAANELGGVTWWLHVFDTSYGTTLVVKLAIVASIVTLGAVNRFRNVARFEQLGPRPLVRTASGEVALATVAFAITGVLTGLPPQPTETPDAPQAEHLLVTGSDFATTMKARLTITPGTVGPNTFLVELTDYDTGEPVDARRVVLLFDLPDRPEVSSELVLELRDDGVWQATSTALALDGTWTVTVLVEQADGSLEIPLEVRLEPPEPQLDISDVPGQPTLYTFTLAGGIQLQAYVDPGEAGRTNQVHITAFDAEGAELPLHHGIVTAIPQSGTPVSPLPQRLSKGHFVANLELDEPGTWTFDLDVLTRNGQTFLLSFEQTFP